MYKLGTPVRDTVTGLAGMLTHYAVYQDGNKFYGFQPRGLNPEGGQPIKSLWITEGRIEGGVEVAQSDIPDLHIEVLGTEVEDAASGFKGIATEMQLHTNGCVHFYVQPKGTQPKNGSAIESCNFDIRRLRGKAIKPLTEKQKIASQKEKPSPMEIGSSCRSVD